MQDDSPVEDVDAWVAQVWPYYQGLVDKYFPTAQLDW